VFELGLFFGKLGRNRCFYIQPDDLELKLPSDLLGIESAKYSKYHPLEDACSRIGKAMLHAMDTLPSRPKLNEEARVRQAGIRWFSDRIKGTWWERIWMHGDKSASALSFFTIEPDDVHNSVCFSDGKAYDPDGAHVASWKSAAARVESVSEKILYVRECLRRDNNTTAWLPGLGEVIFSTSNDIIDLGEGKFWEADESDPKSTVIKLVELRRNINTEHTSTMLKGSDKEKGALIKKMFESWKG
jgi:hypothetical protein